jgi:hypothetical protein
MSATASPFGLRPSFKEGGQVESCVLSSTVLSTYASPIFLYDPIKLGTNGTLELAAAGDAFLGSFMGVEWDDTISGQRRYSNQWPASQAGNNIVAYFTKDPYLTYEIQANATLAIAIVGAQYNTIAPAGNTTTGLSLTSLDVASAAANAQMRVTGLNPGPDNAWGDAFPIIQVQVSNHQYVATRVAI